MTALVLLLCGCVSETAAQGGVVVRGASPTEPPLSAIRLPDNETIVYVMPSGKKYHTAGCSVLNDSAIPVTLEQAKLEGLAPCKRCH